VKSKDDLSRCPTVPKELLQYLATLFPDRCSRLTESEREIFYHSGQRSVVDFLIQKYNEQNENVLSA
jgi:hypothetical protein